MFIPKVAEQKIYSSLYTSGQPKVNTKAVLDRGQWNSRGGSELECLVGSKLMFNSTPPALPALLL